MVVQGAERDLVQLIDFLARGSNLPEVRDTLIARELGLKLEVVGKLLEGLALQGYLRLKRGIQPGYSTWLSAKGQAFCHSTSQEEPDGS